MFNVRTDVKKTSSIHVLRMCLFAFVAFFAVNASATVYFDGSPGTSAPGSTLGGYTMTSFATDVRAAFNVESTVPSPISGNVGLSPSCSHRVVPSSWASWSHGYASDVYFNTTNNPLTLSLPSGTMAFYFYVEGNDFSAVNFTATETSGNVSSGSFSINGAGGARYFGFFSDGAPITSIVVTPQGNPDGFAVGEMGIFQCTTAPVPMCQNKTVALDNSGNASISWTDVDNGSSTGCGSLSYSVSPSSFTCANLGANTVTLTVSDAAGNSATCSSVVTIVDNINPTISSVPGNATVACDNVPAQATLTASDNCSASVNGYQFPSSGMKTNYTHYYPFESNANDAVGSANGTTVNGVSFTSGIIGNAATFNGTNSYISYGTGPSLSGTVPFAISVWIKTSSAAPQLIIQQRDANFVGEFMLAVGSNHAISAVYPGKLYFMVFGNPSGFQFEIVSSSRIDDGKWHHVVAERDGANGRLFVDGVSVGTASGTPTSLTPTISTFVGMDRRDNNKPFNGKIDELRLYSGNTCPNTYDLERTWRAVDGSGNQSAAQQMLHVQDLTVPTFTRPNDITISADASCSYNSSVTFTGDVTNEQDNCSTGLNATFVDAVTPGTCPGSYTILRKWSLVDACNNQAPDQIQTITVHDYTAPVLQSACPADISVCGEQTISWTPPTATDNCGVTMSSNYSPGQNFAVGTYNVVYNFTDCALNNTQCGFTITVYPNPSVSISESQLPDFCQGYAKLTAVVSNASSLTPPLSYVWSGAGSGTDASITAQTNGSYSVSVTDAHGCTSSASYNLNVNPANVLSGYILLANEEVHIHKTTVTGGGVGVRNANKKAKIHDHSTVQTFVKAPTIQVNGSSTVGSQISGQAGVTLPSFVQNTYNNNATTTVSQGSTVTLSGSNYGKIKIKKNATVTFSQSAIYVRSLETEENVHINFSGDACMMVKEGVDLEDNNVVNASSVRLIMYVGDEFEIEGGSNFTGNVLACDDIEAKGHRDGGWRWDDDDCGGGTTAGSHTTMTGMFISKKKIKSGKNVDWYRGDACTIGSGFSARQAVAFDDREAQFNNSEEGTSVSLTPNPADRRVNISLAGFKNEAVTIKIYNSIGTMVYSSALNPSQSELNLDLNNTEFVNGMYTVVAESSTIRASHALVIVR